MKIRIVALMMFIASASYAARPNVVFFLIDDLSHYGITAYGADEISSKLGYFPKTRFKTPRIDSLAKDGLRCDYAFAYPICEPTRIALMSGMNNSRNYIHCKSQHASDITFGGLFQRAGYETCMVGKWKQTRGTKAIPGKDYIFEFGWDEFCCFDVITEGRRFIDPDLVVNGKGTYLQGIDPETGRRWYGPDVFNRYALDFIERNKEKPFFLYYPMVLVHDEHTPTPDTRPKKAYDEFDVNAKYECGHWKGDDQRYLPDMLAYMDKMVGNVLDKLNELNLADNTLVIVMGDNGTKESFVHHLPDGTVMNGRKGDHKENGLHVPLLMRLPGKIPEQTTYRGLVNLTDMLPTLCEAAKVDIPNVDALDGISFWSQAVGKSQDEHRNEIYTWYVGNNSCTSSASLIKYAFDHNFKRYAPHADYPEGRFFDLRSDPYEEAGSRVVNRKWGIRHYSGLEEDKLTAEQKQAYDRLGKVIMDNAYVPVKKLDIKANKTSLKIGQAGQMKYEVVPDDATRHGVVWVSGNPSIASVDKFGVVVGHKQGTATITAYSWDDAFPMANNKSIEYRTDGIQDSVNITVRK